MDTMIAARLHAYGAPMTLDRIPVPQPRPNDVLVEVHACGIVPNLARVVSNFFGTQTPDLKIMPPLPAIFGLDPTGIIRKVGDQVSCGRASASMSILRAAAVRAGCAEAARCSIVRISPSRDISGAPRTSCAPIPMGGLRSS